MSWLKRRREIVLLLGLAIAAIAIPAWASSGGGEVQRASAPSGPGRGEVESASASSGPRDEFSLPPPPTREQLDRTIGCMADHGFGMGSANDPHGVLIPRSETKTRAFRQAARECELPRPPTQAQIRHFGCATAQAHRERRH